MCNELGLADFEAGLLSVRGSSLQALGRVHEAVEATAEAVKKLKPGTDGAYLVPFRHGLALSELGADGESANQFREAHRLLVESMGDLSDDRRASALAVPERQQVVKALQSVVATRTTVRLAKKGVPTGRPLTASDLTSVEWTVTLPADQAEEDAGERRRARLQRLLAEAEAQGAAATVEDLARALDASVRTIRRDLATLRARGVAVATRGRTN